MRRPSMSEIKREVRRAIEERADDINVQAAARVRSDPAMLGRWMRYCGVDSPEAIDYSQPCVYIEWSACEPRVYNLADDPAAFVEATRCDAETFLRYYDPSREGA